MLVRAFFLALLWAGCAGGSRGDGGGAALAGPGAGAGAEPMASAAARELAALRRRPPPPRRRRPPPPRRRPPPPRRRRPPPPRRRPPPPPARAAAGAGPALWTYRVLEEFPHDAASFTQGIQFARRCDAPGGACRDVLFESSGGFEGSSVTEVDLASGTALRRRALPAGEFAEGLTLLRGRLYQLLFQTGKLWRYAADDFAAAQQLQGPLADGWGLTTDGEQLIASDGSGTISWINDSRLEVTRAVAVRDGAAPVRLLNELEWVPAQPPGGGGDAGFASSPGTEQGRPLIYANVFLAECLAQVDPASGAVVGWALLEGLRARAGAPPPSVDGAAVLNGVAWDPARRRLLVTGKRWPKLFAVALEPLAPVAGQGAGALLAEVRGKCIPPAE
jgi:glutamine cyclotransferase